MDFGAGPATTMDEGLAAHQTHNHYPHLIVQINKMIGALLKAPIISVTVTGYLCLIVTCSGSIPASSCPRISRHRSR